MLCVTMTIVYLDLISCIRSSIRAGGDRVERRARLVHEHDVRLDGERAGDAQPLRLAAGQAQAGLVQPVLDLVPQRGLAQRALDDLVQPGLAADAVDARPVGDVVVDRLRERVRLLEDHADAPPDGDRGDVRGVQARPAVADVALDAGARDQVVHPVQGAQHGGLAAPGRADERGDLVLVDGQRDVGDGPEGAVVDGDLRPRRRPVGVPPAPRGCTSVSWSRGTASLAMTSFSGCSMMFLARVAGEAGGDKPGDDHQ